MLRDRRDALVVDPLLEDVERTGVGQPDRSVAETLLGDTEVDLDTGRVERHADVTDPCAGRHPGDVGDGQDLRRGAVEPGAGRPDPHADGHRCVGDQFEQVLDLVVGHERAPAVHLQDQRLRTLADRRGRSRIRPRSSRIGSNRPRHLQHVDPGDVDPRVVGRPTSSIGAGSRAGDGHRIGRICVALREASTAEPSIVAAPPPTARAASMAIASLRKGASGERDLAAIVDRCHESSWWRARGVWGRPR